MTEYDDDYADAIQPAEWVSFLGFSLVWLLGLLMAFWFLAGLAASRVLAESGIASVYHTYDSDQNGTTTASGIRLVNGALTAAHKTLPLRSWAVVTNRSNGKSVRVQITDRGPFVHGRIIDLTQGSANAIGCGDLCPVTVEPAR